MTEEENYSSDTMDEPTDVVDGQRDALSGDVGSPFGFDDAVADGEIVVGEVEEIKKQRDEYLDALRRLQAEFENYRKRTLRQQTEQLDRSGLSLMERFLPVLDALDLALAHAANDDDTSAKEALVQIAALARTTLEKEGLERIDDTGVVFDPMIHDAVSRVEAEQPSGHDPKVVNVMRAGYRLKGKVIRPAMVAVES